MGPTYQSSQAGGQCVRVGPAPAASSGGLRKLMSFREGLMSLIEEIQVLKYLIRS